MACHTEFNLKEIIKFDIVLLGREQQVVLW